MKLLILITLILFSNCSALIEKKEVAVKPSPHTYEWSAYQGNLNCKDAKAKCAGIGMRLPIRDELVTAQKAGLLEKWQTQTNSFHWTSEAYSNEGAYFVDVANGAAYDTNTFQDRHVRCIR